MKRQERKKREREAYRDRERCIENKIENKIRRKQMQAREIEMKEWRERGGS